MRFADTGANETPATGVANVDRMETTDSPDGLTETAGPVLRRTRRQLDDASVLGLPFVALQRRQFHLGLASVGAMHRLAVVTERFLRELLRVATLLGALRPCIAIRVKRDAFDAKS